MFTTILLLAGILVIALMCAVVLLNNHKTAISRTLGVIGMLLILWLAANYLADMTGHFTIWWNRATFIAPLFVFLFSTRFIDELALKKHPKIEAYLTILAVVLAALCMTPLVVAGTQPRVNDSGISGYDVLRGPGYLLVIGWILVLAFRFVSRLVRSFSIAKGQLRQQLKSVMIGVSGALLLGLTTNFLLPVLTGDTSSTKLAPLTGIVFTFFLAIAIIRHGLFNVRFFVVRALGYVSSVAFISALYGFGFFAVAKFLFSINLSAPGIVALSLATGIASLTFQRVKNYFDRISRKLFYQDGYDTEELFNEYNKTLVSTIDLELLLKRTTTLVSSYLKSEYCVIGVQNNDDEEYKIVSTKNLEFDRDEIRYVRQVTPHIHKIVIDVDELPVEMSRVQSILRSNKIAVLVRLTNDVRHTKDGLGYIVLGSKKSGNPYTRQDMVVLETLANELYIALQNALRFEEIERFNETLQQKVLDATRQLRVANKRLKQLNDSKDDFIGMASHQLRTPLTSVKGYVSLVMDGDAGPVNPDQHKLLKQAFSSSQKMVYLIADLLNVSRLKTGKFVIERKPTNLAKLISEEMSQLKEEAALRGLDFSYVAPANFPTLPLDETKTRQVIMNFLDNAIYYTPKGGHVHAELRDLPNSIEFVVSDDGIGVPRAERHHLFTKFYRAKNAQRTRPDGTGLGLYMAQKVVMAQGGAVIFSSDEGKGSTFGFTFPKDMPSDPVSAPIIAHD